MKNYIVVVLSLMAALLVGCSLLSLDDDDATCHNPFNDVKPTNVSQNSLGFYDSAIEYRRPNHFIVLGRVEQWTFCIVREPIDSMLIYSSLTVKHDSDYTKSDHYFKFIAFLLSPDEVSDDVVRLDGDRVLLIDRKKTEYQVLSATVLFDQPPTDNYHSGSFSVEYKDLDDKVCSLTGGRFKLIHEVKDSTYTFSGDFSDLKRYY